MVVPNLLIREVVREEWGIGFRDSSVEFGIEGIGFRGLSVEFGIEGFELGVWDSRV